MGTCLAPFVEVDAEKNEMRVDLSEPRSMKIVGESREGKPVEYFLKVTPTGKLCIV